MSYARRDDLERIRHARRVNAAKTAMTRGAMVVPDDEWPAVRAKMLEFTKLESLTTEQWAYIAAFIERTIALIDRLDGGAA